MELIQLPYDVIEQHIVIYLSIRDLCVLMLINKQFRDIFRNDRFWRVALDSLFLFIGESTLNRSTEYRKVFKYYVAEYNKKRTSTLNEILQDSSRGLLSRSEIYSSWKKLRPLQWPLSRSQLERKEPPQIDWLNEKSKLYTKIALDGYDWTLPYISNEMLDHMEAFLGFAGPDYVSSVYKNYLKN